MRTLKELCERDKTDLESPHIHALLQAEQIALGRCIQRHSWAATSHGGVQLASTGDVASHVGSFVDMEPRDPISLKRCAPRSRHLAREPNEAPIDLRSDPTRPDHAQIYV